MCSLQKRIIYLTYVDDSVIFSHKQEATTSVIESLNKGPEKYVLTYKGYKISYLGLNIKKKSDGKFDVS